MNASTLKTYLNEIVKEMTGNIEFYPYDEEATFSFSYENDEYLIEGSGIVGGDWDVNGDGYYEEFQATCQKYKT